MAYQQDTAFRGIALHHAYGTLRVSVMHNTRFPTLREQTRVDDGHGRGRRRTAFLFSLSYSAPWQQRNGSGALATSTIGTGATPALRLYVSSRFLRGVPHSHASFCTWAWTHGRSGMCILSSFMGCSTDRKRRSRNGRPAAMCDVRGQGGRYEISAFFFAQRTYPYCDGLLAVFSTLDRAHILDRRAHS